jgi:hypothetical protein
MESSKFFKRIKEICDSKYKDYHIFLTSDNDEIYNKAILTFDKKCVIYDDEIIQHLDKNKDSKGCFSKIFSDNYILSQCTKMLFFTKNSNFGTIAALSACHKNIYDLYGDLVKKEDLLVLNDISNKKNK